MRVIYKAPGEYPEIIEMENTLDALQEKVDGLVESVTMPGGSTCVLCNEEGRLRGMADNIVLAGVDFVGPILVVGVDGEDFCDLEDAEYLLEALRMQEDVRRVTAAELQRQWEART